MYTYIYVYILMHMYIHIHICMLVYIYVYIHIHICMYICIYIYICMCVYIYIYIMKREQGRTSHCKDPYKHIQAVCRSVWQCAAECCSVLQRVAACCRGENQPCKDQASAQRLRSNIPWQTQPANRCSTVTRYTDGCWDTKWHGLIVSDRLESHSRLEWLPRFSSDSSNSSLGKDTRYLWQRVTDSRVTQKSHSGRPRTGQFPIFSVGW